MKEIRAIHVHID